MSKLNEDHQRIELKPYQKQIINDIEKLYKDKQVTLILPTKSVPVYIQQSGRSLRPRIKWYQRLYNYLTRRRPVVILDFDGNKKRVTFESGLWQIACNQCRAHGSCIWREHDADNRGCGFVEY